MNNQNDHPIGITRLGEDERAYLLRRADDHRQLAEKTREAGSRTIHLRLERLYTERAELID